MENQDARHLSPSAQEDLRLRVVQAVNKGMTQCEAAQVFHVSRAIVNDWMARFRKGGTQALRSQARGRPCGNGLGPETSGAASRLILDHCPDGIGLPFLLWSWESVQYLLRTRFDTVTSRWTVNRILVEWGLKPRTTNHRITSADLRRQLEGPFRSVRSWAAQGRYVAYQLRLERLWTDRPRSEECRDRGVAKSMLYVEKGRGDTEFMVIEGELTAAHVIEFIDRAPRASGTRVLLLDEERPIYSSRAIREWLDQKSHILKLWPMARLEDVAHVR